MSKICVIYTGGTIGSVVKDGYVSPDSKCIGMLTNEYIKKYGADICFEEITPFSMLSENIQPKNIAALQETVAQALNNDCDGIVITHGTDTLCFSANLLSQLFCNATKPIVLVSALLPLADSQSNGFINFDGGVAFIKEGIPGVYVSFANDNEPCRIHLASRVCEPEQITGFMHSIKDLYFGTIIDGKFYHNSADNNPSVTKICNNASQPELADIDDNILVIHSRALLNYKMYDIEAMSPKAVVIKLYHSGTTCTQGDIYNTAEFITRCSNKNIPVILGPVDSEANVYAGMEELADKCIWAEDISFEMTVVKVMLALGADKDIKEVLKGNYFFEKI